MCLLLLRNDVLLSSFWFDFCLLDLFFSLFDRDFFDLLWVRFSLLLLLSYSCSLIWTTDSMASLQLTTSFLSSCKNKLDLSIWVLLFNPLLSKHQISSRLYEKTTLLKLSVKQLKSPLLISNQLLSSESSKFLRKVNLNSTLVFILTALFILSSFFTNIFVFLKCLLKISTFGLINEVDFP